MKPTCVLVSPVCPHPTGSGLQQRAFHLLVDSAKQYAVTLVLATQAPSCEAPHPDVQRLVHTLVWCEPVTASRRLERVALLFPLLAWLRPSLAAGWLSIDRNAARPLLFADVTALVVFRLRSTSVAHALFAQGELPKRRVLDLDDHESPTLWSIGHVALRRGRLRLAVRSFGSAIQLFGLERRVLRSFTEITYASSADRPRLRPLLSPATQLYQRGNQVLFPHSSRARAPESGFTLLFVGTLSYFPNEDAALWIAEKLVPELRRQLPHVFHIRIVGRGARAQLANRLAQVKEIVFQGAVEDVTSIYNQSHAALIPLRCGGGTKVKLLEAAAHKCPIIATSHSLRGLPFLDPQEVLCGSSAAVFASHCAATLASPKAAADRAARAYARLADMVAGENSTKRPPSSK